MKVEPINVWSVHHPKDKWGLTVPMIYVDRATLVQHLKSNSLWPLRNGWEIVEIAVTAAPMKVGAA